MHHSTLNNTPAEYSVSQPSKGSKDPIDTNTKNLHLTYKIYRYIKSTTYL